MVRTLRLVACSVPAASGRDSRKALCPVCAPEYDSERPSLAALPEFLTPGAVPQKAGGSLPDLVIVRVYKGGNQTKAANDFSKDATKLAEQWYVPVSQSWADNKRTGRIRLLMLIVYWPLLLVRKRGGTLTVTYRYQPPQPPAPPQPPQWPTSQP
jgi:hypothetical protein